MLLGAREKESQQKTGKGSSLKTEKNGKMNSKRQCEEVWKISRRKEISKARAKLSDNKVNGPEDAIVSEMIKKVALEESTLLRGPFKNG